MCQKWTQTFSSTFWLTVTSLSLSGKDRLLSLQKLAVSVTESYCCGESFLAYSTHQSVNKIMSGKPSFLSFHSLSNARKCFRSWVRNKTSNNQVKQLLVQQEPHHSVTCHGGHTTLWHLSWGPHHSVTSAMGATPLCDICHGGHTTLLHLSWGPHHSVTSAMGATPFCDICHGGHTTLLHLSWGPHHSMTSVMGATPLCDIYHGCHTTW